MDTKFRRAHAKQTGLHERSSSASNNTIDSSPSKTTAAWHSPAMPFVRKQRATCACRHSSGNMSRRRDLAQSIFQNEGLAQFRTASRFLPQSGETRPKLKPDRPMSATKTSAEDRQILAGHRPMSANLNAGIGQLAPGIGQTLWMGISLTHNSMQTYPLRPDQHEQRHMWFSESPHPDPGPGWGLRRCPREWLLRGRHGAPFDSGRGLLQHGAEALRHAASGVPFTRSHHWYSPPPPDRAVCAPGGRMAQRWSLCEDLVQCKSDLGSSPGRARPICSWSGCPHPGMSKSGVRRIWSPLHPLRRCAGHICD